MTARTAHPARLAVLGCALAAASLVAALTPPASASPSRAGAFHPGPNIAVPGGFSIGPLSRVKSNNWAGYVDKVHVFSVVRTTWRQPRVICATTDSVAAFWVGLDGYTTPTVEQAGSLAYCHNGSPTYYTWWEMYPRNTVQLMHASVRPGDKITSSVVRNGTSYTLKVVDHTHPGNSFTRYTTCAACKGASAEWIAERVTGKDGLLPLARFGHVAFFASTVGVGTARGSINTYVHDSLTMVNSHGMTMASVTQLKKGGNLFGVTWHRRH